MSAIPMWILLALVGVAILFVVGAVAFALVLVTRRSKGAPRHGGYGAAPYAPPNHQRRPTYADGGHAGFAGTSGASVDGGWSPSGDGGASGSGGFGGDGGGGGAGDGGGGGGGV
ncbi:hypothetical protein J4H86_25375 [Spiractinospora alimapuensis]|uniref:hypothetical protein n=1 Tax=Spiractinospora alimapuensis TaxID=2820884 RepID=UPI001F17EEB2|nr:hypothetical protein [Spiractinospora alimapuensis]QVQ52024.1 hypothetical protein J4H86_25375 [Spiractinospora alimapuensis]